MTKKERAERQKMRKEVTALTEDIDDIRLMLQDLRRNVNIRRRQIARWERAADAIEKCLERNIQMRSVLMRHLGIEP